MPQLRSGSRPQRQAAVEAKAKLKEVPQTKGKGLQSEPGTVTNWHCSQAPKPVVLPCLHLRSYIGHQPAASPLGQANVKAAAGQGANMKGKEEGQTDKEKQTQEKIKEEEASTAPLPEKVSSPCIAQAFQGNLYSACLLTPVTG